MLRLQLQHSKPTICGLTLPRCLECTRPLSSPKQDGDGEAGFLSSQELTFDFGFPLKWNNENYIATSWRLLTQSRVLQYNGGVFES